MIRLLAEPYFKGKSTWLGLLKNLVYVQWLIFTKEVSMRNVALFFILLTSWAFAQDNPSERICVQPDQILFHQNSIFVHIDNQWIETESIHADARGIYITDDIRDIFHWICPKCGYQNGLFDKRCQNCGY
jgi:hypothetical protein